MRILTYHTHEGYQYELARTGHQFFHLASKERTAGWSTQCRPQPANVTYVRREEIDFKEFDLLLTQSTGQWMESRGWPVRKRLHLEHTIPSRPTLIPVEGCPIVYIGECSRLAWKRPGTVIRHGLSMEDWPVSVGAVPKALSVVNQFKRRDWCCGYSVWAEATRGIPAEIKGHGNEDIDPTIRGSGDWSELKGWYRDHVVFLNTSTHSPIPMALLEAMACGMPVVSLATCEIPYFIRDGIDGLLAKDATEARYCLLLLLGNKDLQEKFRRAARERTAEVCSSERFVREWNKVFEEAAS